MIFKTKKVKGDCFRHASTPVVLLGNGTGRSTASDFQVYLERVFQHYTGCSETEDGLVVLLVDGSKTHLTADVLFAAKKLRVFLISFPSHSTDVVQPLDVSILAPLKRKIRRSQDRCVHSHQGHSLTHSRFVELVTGAWGSVARTTQVKESFRATGLFPLSFDGFMEHAPVPRIRDDVPAPNIGIEPPDEGVANTSGNNDPPPPMSDASSQVCSRAINSAMHDDPTSMNFGGFVTSEELFRACTAANSTRASAAQPSGDVPEEQHSVPRLPGPHRHDAELLLQTMTIQQTRVLQCLRQERGCDEVDLWSTTRTAATPKTMLAPNGQPDGCSGLVTLTPIATHQPQNASAQISCSCF